MGFCLLLLWLMCALRKVCAVAAAVVVLVVVGNRTLSGRFYGRNRAVGDERRMLVAVLVGQGWTSGGLGVVCSAWRIDAGVGMSFLEFWVIGDMEYQNRGLQMAVFSSFSSLLGWDVGEDRSCRYSKHARSVGLLSRWVPGL